MRNLKKILLITGNILLSEVALADISLFPPEFEEYYKFTPKIVNFKNLDGSTSKILLDVMYDRIKLSSNVKSKDNLAYILKLNNITENYIKVIVSDIEDGIENSSSCEQGLISKCTILPIDYDFIYDYDNNTLYFFTNPSLLKSKVNNSQSGYYSSKSLEPSLINHFEFSADSYNQSSNNYVISNESILGLPYGFINTDFQYRSVDNDFEIYKAQYRVNFDNYHLRLGLSRSFDYFNSTDFLNMNSSVLNNLEKSIQFGTSNNLIVGKKNKEKVIDFFAPAEGTLVVRDNNKIILDKIVPQGQGQISYEELPYGRYDVSIEVKSGERVLYSAQHTIYNQPSDMLALGNFDYLISAGSINSSELNDINFNSDEDTPFIKGLISYKILNSTQLGLGTTLSEEGYVAHVGIKTYLPFNISIDGSYNTFTTTEKYFTSNIQISRLNLSYEGYRGSEQNNLAKTLFGTGEYDKIYAGASYPLTRQLYGNISINYQNRDNSSNYNYESITTSLGLSAHIANDISIDFNLNYSDDFSSSKINYDDIYASISVNIGLTETGNTRFGSLMYGNRQSPSMMRNYLTSSDIYNDKHSYATVTAGNSYHRKETENTSISDLSLSANINNSKFESGLYATYSNDNYYGVSANFSSTQIITGNGIYLTSDRSSAYGLVSLESKNDLTFSDNSQGYLTISNSTGDIVNSSTINGQQSVVPLYNYEEYRLMIDTLTMDLHNNGTSSLSGFLHPGNVLNLITTVGQTSNVIVGFSDLFNNPITQLKCEGIGCVSVTPLVDGVYNLVLSEKYPYKLTSGELECGIRVNNNNEINYGNKLCLPILNIGETANISSSGLTKTVQYIGSFSLETDIDGIINTLEKNKIQIHKRDGQRLVSLYISYDENLSLSQVNALDAILLFANNNPALNVGYNN